MSSSMAMETRIPQAARRLRLTALVVLAAGASLSAFLWHARRDFERRELASALAAECDSLAASVAREVETFASVLASVRQLHTVSAHITDDDFREFVTKGMVHQASVLHAFGFAQRVVAADRQRVEQSSGGPRALHITEFDNAGGFRRAGDRPQYFPLTYQFPNDGLGVSNGFDLATAPGVSDAIMRMSLAGGLAIGGPGWGPDGRDFPAFAPIIYVMTNPDGTTAGGYLNGFAIGLLRPLAILGPALKLAEARGLKLALVDRPPSDAGAIVEGDFESRRPIEVLGQIWTLRCSPEQRFTSHFLTAQPLLLLAGGLVTSGLLALQLLVLSRRAASVENAVRERTTELRKANSELEKSISARRDLEQEILNISTREQQRIGRDLHDSLGQKLTGATYLTRALAEELAGAGVVHSEAAGKINAILKDAVSQARRIARGLSPIDLSEGGLADALRRLAEETSSVFGISCTFRGDSAPVLAGGTTASNLYQIAQEAVNNAIRHGQATEITILLENSDASGKTGGELVVEDDGRGLPPGSTQSGGMGLRIMRYRADLIGGEVKIERGREGGTIVVCRFPVGQ